MRKIMRSQKIVNVVLVLSALCMGIVLTATPSHAFTCGTDTITDADGNTYKTVLIGEQCWMATNMATTKYPDGSAITKGPATHREGDWDADQSYYSCPPNTSNDGEDCAAATSSNLGHLYQWSAAMNGIAQCVPRFFNDSLLQAHLVVEKTRI